MRYTFFVDFDGTITQRDTGAAMVEEFARDGWQEINRLWESRELSTQECALRTFELMDTTPAQLQELLNTIPIDEHFPDFLQWCRINQDPVYVLSDGYDVNIETILQRYSIQVPYYSNCLLYDNGFRIESPYRSEACGRCGTCKSTLMQALRSDQRQTVYIGDGYSDICAAQKADLLFAKDVLLRYCRKHDIPAVPFQSFRDVISWLQTRP